MIEKVFSDYDTLIAILNNRGLDINSINDTAYAKDIISRLGYYNLINGYQKLFIDPSTNKFIQGSKLQEIHALYQFDSQLRSILLKYILVIETHIKSLISYFFSEKYGHKNYLVFTNFNTSLKDAESKITVLISDIHRQITNRYSDPCISHYLKTYGYIPLWVLTNILTLGTVSKFYSLMQQPEKQSISKIFHIMDNELESRLAYISSIRNMCAHGNRIYCHRTTKTLIDTKYHKSLSIRTNQAREFVYGKRDLFAVLIALKGLLSNNEYSKLIKELYRAIGILKNKINTISIDNVTLEMGFPINWRDLANL